MTPSIARRVMLDADSTALDCIFALVLAWCIISIKRSIARPVCTSMVYVKVRCKNRYTILIDEGSRGLPPPAPGASRASCWLRLECLAEGAVGRRRRRGWGVSRHGHCGRHHGRRCCSKVLQGGRERRCVARDERCPDGCLLYPGIEAWVCDPNDTNSTFARGYTRRTGLWDKL